MIAANYFDGHSARRHAVELETGDGVLAVTGAAIARRYPYADVRLAEPFAGAPAMLDFPDGSHCEVAGADDRHALAGALGYRKSRVVQWQERWYGALLALVLLIAAGAAIVQWGIPAAAARIAESIPPSLDAALGQKTLRALDAKLLSGSRLSEQRIDEVQAVFRGVLPASARLPLRLLVRSSPQLNANALALPDGTIVITDAMLLHILGKATEFGPVESAQLAGVLAHEIGHVEGRHSVRAMARSSLTAAASAALFGDFSAVAAGAPAVLMNLRYSREMESEADEYAIAVLRQKGLSPAVLADLFDSLQSADPEARLALPRWMTRSMAYVSSHPSGDERSARLRKGATAARGRQP